MNAKYRLLVRCALLSAIVVGIIPLTGCGGVDRRDDRRDYRDDRRDTRQDTRDTRQEERRTY